MANWFTAFLSAFFRGRPPGPPGPTSANGASSFHLFWKLSGRFQEVSAVLEVIDPPLARSLYFWALQASFGADGSTFGGAHIGLQHHPRYPGSTAVNWGGYDDAGRELDGSVSELPSTLNNANTRDFGWVARRRYRLRVYRAPEDGPGGVTAWRGEVVDLTDGTTTVIRDLYGGGEYLVSPMVWSEVFAKCADGTAAVRWSELQAITIDGATVTPTEVEVNYQSAADGGCPNTNSFVDGPGRIVQRSSIDRVTSPGARLRVGV